MEYAGDFSVLCPTTAEYYEDDRKTKSTYFETIIESKANKPRKAYVALYNGNFESIPEEENILKIITEQWKKDDRLHKAQLESEFVKLRELLQD